MARLKRNARLVPAAVANRLADRIRDGAIETKSRLGLRDCCIGLADRIRDGAIETAH